MKHQNKKVSRRLAAAMMAGAMMVSMVGMTAFAKEPAGKPEEGTTLETPVAEANIKIKKTINKPADIYMPSATFEFTVTDSVDENVETGAVVLTDDEIASSPAATDLGKTSVTIADDPINVKVDASKFKQPGEYTFVISEAEGSYETGLDWEAQDLILKVVIIRDEADNTMKVYGYSLYSQTNPSSKLDAFTNDYMKGSSGEDITNTFELSKKVEGNFATSADKTTKHFIFNVKIDNEQLGTTAKWYKVEVSHADDCGDNGENDVSYIQANSAEATPIKLADGEKVVIYGLTGNETISVNENDYSVDGFKKVEYQLDKGVAVEGSRVNDISGSADHTLAFTNTKDAVSPTGIALTVAPYIIMVAAAAGVAVLFLRRRNNEF